MSAFNLESIAHLRYSKRFELLVVLVIVSSAILAGAKTVDTVHQYADAIAIADASISIFFCLEIVVRWIGYDRSFKKFFREPWNCFDFFIVAVSLIPIADTASITVARLLRLVRVLRLISILPDLRFLIETFASSLYKLANVLLLMFIVIYIYGVLGSTLFASINEALWGDIGLAMLTLFRVITLEDWTDILYEVQDTYWWAWIYFISFIFLTAFGFLNMFVGIIVQTYSENLQKRSQQPEIAESLSGKQPENYSEMDLIKQLEQQLAVRFGQEGGQSVSSEQRSQQELELLVGLQKLKRLLKQSDEDQN